MRVVSGSHAASSSSRARTLPSLQCGAAAPDVVGAPLFRGGFDVPVSMSTLSHHLKVLREAGLVRVSPEGSHRRHELRSDELEGRYPGVLSSIISAAGSE
ncbi:helix-turn-helix transcriptional regulator [Nocardia cyriacigeorgica]|uniref:Helix-turn-helix transcriptional regulator n=1 Tax=Nocardia cyriacigeorgica TaxID=135487 RepID=A0A6P1DB51_9NOCA|nr:helix-turn-helix domain-containing protein [Nocardia cyriacigeorgica]NEW37884.1 helix-turn-helix transcriptional regulator [Nocardia cyriacigeorgica]NEW47946.1 helix-turn-helix transcriptional regulator [Nocardia cyriacigeorgica]NEW48732.1 helix-turn-helix transcriptional regulator [Nocardia cyriacigeorgica]NEW58234.1 helix-turn-helix transcriptional regulator [Nocardia cyriacigeorgica]